MFAAPCPPWRSLAWLLAAALLVGRATAAAPLPPTTADELVMWVIPAPRGIDWSSPRGLLLGSAGNLVDLRHLTDRQSIGHVFVHVRSSLEGRDELTGMNVRASREQLQLVMQDGYGLGILGADMMGRLETPEELREKLALRAETGVLTFLRVLLRPEAAARLVRFLDEYRARGLDDHYGGANRPRFGEGGGCSAFGVAFLELAGLMEPEYQDRWRVVFRVPHELYGGPLTQRSVYVHRVLRWGRWAEADEPHVTSMFWDPSRMHAWIRETHRAELEAPTGRWYPEARGEVLGLRVDARQRPVPTEAIWLQDPPGTPHPWGLQASVRRKPRPSEAEADAHIDAHVDAAAAQ